MVKHPDRLLRARMNALLQTLESLSITEAKWLLHLYGDTLVNFCILGQWTNIDRLARLRDPANLIRCINPISFWGGPARGIKQFEGTVATFVADRMLFHWQQSGIEFKWLIRFNQFDSTSIDKQLAEFIPAELKQVTKLPPAPETIDDNDPVVETCLVGGKTLKIHESGVQRWSSSTVVGGNTNVCHI